MAATLIHEPAFTAEDSARLSKTDLTRCTLLMHIGPHQLAYTLLDPETQTFLAVKGYYFDAGTGGYSLIEILEQCFDQNRILFTAFQQTRISFDTPEFTLVPSAVFDPTLKRDYLSFLHPEHPHSFVLYDQLRADKAVNVFRADKDVAGYLKKDFPSARFYHAQTAFLEAIRKYGPLGGSQAYVRVVTGSIIVTVVSSGKLLLMQNYPITHGADALYFTVNALKQLRLPAGSTEVYVSGEIEDDAPLYQELVQEIPTLAWLRRPEAFSYVPAFEDYPGHYFYTLIALASCE